LGSLLNGIYGAFDPTLVFGCMVIGLTVARLHVALIGGMLWSIPVETIDFFTPESEPPPMFNSWLFDTGAEVTLGLAAVVILWLAKRVVSIVVQRQRDRLGV
jgi:hypothetical protein